MLIEKYFCEDEKKQGNLMSIIAIEKHAIANVFPSYYYYWVVLISFFRSHNYNCRLSGHFFYLISPGKLTGYEACKSSNGLTELTDFFMDESFWESAK